MNQSLDQFADAERAVSAQKLRDQTLPIEATEALENIRAVMSVLYAPAADEASAAAFRLIHAILDQTA